MSKDETRRNSSLTLMFVIIPWLRPVYVFLWMVLLAVRMVADVIETHNVIPSLKFKTCMTIKS